MVQEPSVQSGGRTWTRAQADAAYLVGSLEEDAYLTLVGSWPPSAMGSSPLSTWSW